MRLKMHMSDLSFTVPFLYNMYSYAVIPATFYACVGETCVIFPSRYTVQTLIYVILSFYGQLPGHCS